jgi:predicted DsbA family dithiol-disulfide isomerase
MTATVEVFADVTCPFTHVGLKQVVRHLAELDRAILVHVRAWPLEWVNGEPLDSTAVAAKIDALQTQLGVDDFSGFRSDRWPSTTIPALNLAAAAHTSDPSTGLEVSLELRTALFKRGLDIGDHRVLGSIATAYGLRAPSSQPSRTIRDDYEQGRLRGVRGSPHFWIDDDEYFCPSLDIGHDRAGKLTASFDTQGLARFISRVDARS